MRPAVIAGARPNFVKVAPLLRALREEGAAPLLVHTGQHYDRALSDAFFDDLCIPPPDVNLGVGSGSHGAQTANVIVAFEEWLDSTGRVGADVDQVVTVGDVNSTVACALVAAKREIPVAHVEAGLRSFDRTMPEEINRVLVDAIATWLFTPSDDAVQNLLAEGIDPSRIFRSGNVMVDSLLESLPQAMASTVLDRLEIDGRYGLVTLHRPALVDDPDRLGDVLDALADIASDLPLVFPVHPRTRAKLEAAGLARRGLADGLRFVDPVGYLDFLRLQAGAALVLTDSGGVQEETTVLGVPCLTLRDNTERPITITHGTNELVGLDPDRIRLAAKAALGRAFTQRRPPLWDGNAATRIAAVLVAGTPSVEWVPRTIARAHDGVRPACSSKPLALAFG